MKRNDIILGVLIAAIPALLFLNTWQAYRFDRLERAIERASARQIELFERNKRHLAGIAALRSPSRIEPLARNELELEQTFGGPRVELIPNARRED